MGLSIKSEYGGGVSLRHLHIQSTRWNMVTPDGTEILSQWPDAQPFRIVCDAVQQTLLELLADETIKYSTTAAEQAAVDRTRRIIEKFHQGNVFGVLPEKPGG